MRKIIGAMTIGAMLGGTATFAALSAAGAAAKTARDAQFAELRALRARLSAPDVTTAEVARTLDLMMTIDAWDKR